MNANEVIATLATQRSAPRSTRTTTSTPVSRATTSSRRRSTSRPPPASASDLMPALDHLAAALERKATEFADVVKSGRTHLMDATPGHPRPGVRRLRGPGPATGSSGSAPTLPRVAELPLGGTAVGTGINTPPGFAAQVIDELDRADRAAAHRGAQPLRGAGRAGRRWSRLRASCARSPSACTKICNDLRWMGSGPRAGLGEIDLPDLQPGFEHHAGQGEPGDLRGHLDGLRAGDRQRRRRSRSPAPAGNFELNVMLPVIARNLLESIRLLAQRLAAAGRPVHRRHRGQRRALPRARPSRRRRSSPR